jgi:hypothetical protein
MSDSRQKFTKEQVADALKVRCPACSAPIDHGCMMIVWDLKTRNTYLKDRHPHARRVLVAEKFSNSTDNARLQ